MSVIDILAPIAIIAIIAVVAFFVFVTLVGLIMWISSFALGEQRSDEIGGAIFEYVFTWGHYQERKKRRAEIAARQREVSLKDTALRAAASPDQFIAELQLSPQLQQFPQLEPALRACYTQSLKANIAVPDPRHVWYRPFADNWKQRLADFQAQLPVIQSSPFTFVPVFTNQQFRDVIEPLAAYAPSRGEFMQHFTQHFASAPFPLPEARRFGGHYIVAPSGLGKTTLLMAMVMDDLKDVFADKKSLVILDPKGQLTDAVKRLACFANNDKLVLIDPRDDISISPFDIDAPEVTDKVDFIVYMIDGTAQPLTDKMKTFLRPCIRALLTHPDYPKPTLRTLEQLILKGPRLVRNQLEGEFIEFSETHPDPRMRDFMLLKFPNDAEFRETKSQILTRFLALEENPIIGKWFECTKTKFNIGNEINNAKCVVVNVSEEILSADAISLFGRFVIAQVRAAATRRKNEDPNNIPTFVYVDECDQIIKHDAGNVEAYVDKLRSRSIGIILSHQRKGQFRENPATLDALLNCPIRFANVDEDADFLTKPMRVEDASQLRLPTGQFATYIRQGTPQTAVITVQKPELEFMTDSEQEAIRLVMRARYGRDPEPTPEPPRAPEPPKAKPAKKKVDKKPLERF